MNWGCAGLLAGGECSEPFIKGDELEYGLHLAFSDHWPVLFIPRVGENCHQIYLETPIWPLPTGLLLWMLLTDLRRWRARRNHPGPRCNSCGYSLIGNTTSRCPECGTSIRA